MMEGVYRWIQNIVYYLIFVTMILNLLPSGKYEKYLKLFTGCILILLVIQPVTGGLRLEEQISGLFNSLSFENDVGEITKDLDGMEEKRLNTLVSRYEKAAGEDVARLAGLNGYEAQEVLVRITGDKDSPDFGKVEHVTVFLKEDPEEGTEALEEPAGWEREKNGGIEAVEQIKIEVGLADPDTDESYVTASGTVSQDLFRGLRKEIAGYYQMEEGYVEIRLENE